MKIKNSYLSLALLLLSAIILVYFTSNIISKILFPFYCLLFYKSKNNALWIVFLFILIQTPGGLFSGGQRGDLARLPIYTLIGGVSITFEQLLLITGLLKVFKRKANYKPIGFITKYIKFMGSYFILLVFLSFVLGVSFDGLRTIYKIIINLSLFYSVYFLFKEECEFVEFFKLVFPFAFVALFLQIYSLTFGHQLITVFKPAVLSTRGVFGIDAEVIRPIEMSFVLLFSFFGSLYYFILNKNYFNKQYLLIVNVASYLSIFITATRAWFLAFSISYILFFLLLPKIMFKNILKNSVVIVIAIFSFFSVSLLKNQFSSAFTRIKTIELVARGDITAGGSLKRFDVRGPNVMKAFQNSTILFGAGFSDFYMKNSDGHVGFQNYLLNSGIIGIISLLFLFANIIFFSLKIGFRIKTNNPYKNALRCFIVWLLAIIILNTSTQIIGYDVNLTCVLFLSMFIYFFNNQIKNAYKFELERIY